MRVPLRLSEAFSQEHQSPFEQWLSTFAQEQGLIEDSTEVGSKRFLSRSVAPHIERLSNLFNRIGEGTPGERNYWRDSSNPKNLRLAYLLGFMPNNLFRVASIWAELSRLGFRWPDERFKEFHALELGSGPAAGAAGVAAGERYAPTGLPDAVEWSLIEKDRAMLGLGEAWLGNYASQLGHARWNTRGFHRNLTLKDELLPRSAPRYDLWVMSYFMNEFQEPAEQVADSFIRTWDRHLADEGLVILVEPALKAESRRILEFRRALIDKITPAKPSKSDYRYKVLLPCLGEQACGALANPEDWCHEQVSWWRPAYLRRLDQITGLDHKTLSFTYLVVAKTERPIHELLPSLGEAATERRYRLVSPARAQGQDDEFYVCGRDGKRRARYRRKKSKDGKREFSRGDILLDAELRGAPEASRVESFEWPREPKTDE